MHHKDEKKKGSEKFKFYKILQHAVGNQVLFSNLNNGGVRRCNKLTLCYLYTSGGELSSWMLHSKCSKLCHTLTSLSFSSTVHPVWFCSTEARNIWLMTLRGHFTFTGSCACLILQDFCSSRSLQIVETLVQSIKLKLCL